jgi:hypothetical protein
MNFSDIRDILEVGVFNKCLKVYFLNRVRVKDLFFEGFIVDG